MAQEIERKYLLKSDSWRELVTRSVLITQGYFPSSGVTVRARISGDEGFLTIKGKCSDNLVRSEFEYRVPVEDVRSMLEEFCGTRVVEKIRHYVPAENGLVWEIDEYLGLNKGLFTAEIELPYPDMQYTVPDWTGEDVSMVPRYSNGALSKHPYSLWENET